MKQTINGAQFKQMILFASACLENEKTQINDLNVFPVPDGDTGTNMCLTLNSARDALRKEDPETISRAADLTASALLRGARGNSGVILSLLFRGMSRSLKDKTEADGVDLALALSEGVGAAYKAVMKPAEGTILTVSRLAAAHAVATARKSTCAEQVLSEAIVEGYKALAETMHQNPVLEKAGVIDAGGKGYLLILEGMLRALKGEALPEVTAAGEAKEKADFQDFDTEEITFGYCTEFIVNRETKRDPELLRGFLSRLGDSLVVVDDDEIIKVHVHTDHPGKALEEALLYGSFLTVKIENMREQHSGLVEAEPAAPARKIAAPEKPFGFLAVCAGDGLAEVFRDLGADGVISGGQTMNPSTEDILREIDKTPAEVVVVLPNNSNIIMAAQQCIPLAEGKRVVVIPTKTIPQGISALLAADGMEDEASLTEAMTEAIGRVSTYQVTYAARNSDFDGHNITEGDCLILAENALFETGPDRHSLMEALACHVAARDGGAEFITIFSGCDADEAEAEQVLALFEQSCPGAEVSLIPGGQPVYSFLISAE